MFETSRCSVSFSRSSLLESPCLCRTAEWIPGSVRDREGFSLVDTCSQRIKKFAATSLKGRTEAQSRYWQHSPSDVCGQVLGKSEPRNRGRLCRRSRMGEHDDHCSNDNTSNKQLVLTASMVATRSRVPRQQRNVVAPHSDINPSSSQNGKHESTTVTLRTDDRAPATWNETSNTSFGTKTTGK